jgi:hypothetical protein
MKVNPLEQLADNVAAEMANRKVLNVVVVATDDFARAMRARGFKAEITEALMRSPLGGFEAKTCVRISKKRGRR